MKAGDLVRLKSGGPVMTVERVSEDKEGFIPATRCSWFIGPEPSRADFVYQTLILCDYQGNAMKNEKIPGEINLKTGLAIGASPLTTPEEVSEAAGTLLLKAYAAYGAETGFWNAVNALVIAGNSGK